MQMPSLSTTLRIFAVIRLVLLSALFIIPYDAYSFTPQPINNASISPIFSAFAAILDNDPSIYQFVEQTHEQQIDIIRNGTFDHFSTAWGADVISTTLAIIPDNLIRYIDILY